MKSLCEKENTPNNAVEMADSLLKKGVKGRVSGGWKGSCKVEEGVAEINNQLCTAMFTMVLSEETARQFTSPPSVVPTVIIVTRTGSGYDRICVTFGLGS